MRLVVAKIGKVSYPQITNLCEIYFERLKAFVKIENEEFKNLSSLTRRFPPSSEHPWVLLDEKGKNWSSKELAQQLKEWTDNPGIKTLVFVIGGPMGVDAETKRSVKWTWALSRATFTSDMSWLICVEQIYRAYSILKNTGYHHE